MAPFLVIRIGNELLPISGLEGCGGGELAFTEYLLHFLSGDKSVRFLLFSRPFSKETQLKHLGRVNADPYALLDFLVTDPRWFGSLVGKRASELKKRMRRDIVFVPYTPQEKFFLSLIRRSLVRKPATGYLALRFYIRVRHLLKKERLSEGLLYFINRPFAFLFPKTFSFGLFMQNSHLVSRIPVVQSVINRHLERYALVDWASAFLLQEYQQRNPHHKGRILHLCLPLVHEVLASNISSLEGISFWKQNLYPAIPGKPDKTVRILYVGRIVPEKGVHVLLDAMTLLSDALQKQDLSLELTLVGTPVIGKSVASSYYHSILERIEHLHEPRGKLRLQVRHIPYLNRVELTQRYLATDIVVCPSVWEEPWAYVKLEALFFKAVLIASKAGGIPEGLTSGKDCFLIEKGDAKALASRLESVLLGISKKDASLKALCERGHTLVASQYLTQNRYKRFLAGIQSVFAGKALARRTPRK